MDSVLFNKQETHADSMQNRTMPQQQLEKVIYHKQLRLFIKR